MVAPVKLECFDKLSVTEQLVDDTELLDPPVAHPQVAEAEIEVEADLADEDPTEQFAQTLQGLIRAVERAADAGTARLLQNTAASLAESLDALLPALMHDGLAQEIAQVTTRVAADRPRGPLELSLPGSLHEDVLAALHDLAPPLPVSIVEDDALPDGSAHLSWPSGGATIDGEQILSDARALLKRRLASFTEETL